MSELTNAIFKNQKHYLSSPFGKRAVISTSKGNTSSFHSGADYATHSVKLPQYAVADGVITSCGVDTNYGDAKYVWVKYPSLGVRMLHYHLDSIAVKGGQSVKKGTLLGKTGKTGRATGIHLHLGIKKIGSDTYIDPEKWSKENYGRENKKTAYTKGDYVVNTSVLNVRSGPSTAYKIKNYSAFTSNAKKQVLALCGKKISGYVKGVEFTALEINGSWGRTPSGWVCLDYCKKL